MIPVFLDSARKHKNLARTYKNWLPDEGRVISWMEQEVPFHVVPHPNQRFKALQQAYIESFLPEKDDIDLTHCGVTEILAAKYKVANIDQVADAQVHLTTTQ
jgi:hypothetical protein